MIWGLECGLICLMLIVNFFNCFSGTHVPAFYSTLDCIYFTIFYKIFVTAWIQIICDNICTFFGRSNCQWTNPTENISKTLIRLNKLQYSISLFLQPGTPINFLKIKFKIHTNFPHPYLIILITRHMLQNRSPVYIMQFLSFIHNSFDISAFGQCDLTNNIQIFLLICCKIVMCDMSGCLEAIWKWNVFLTVLYILEHIEYLLIGQIVEIQLDLTFNYLQFLPLLLINPQHINTKIS